VAELWDVQLVLEAEPDHPIFSVTNNQF